MSTRKIRGCFGRLLRTWDEPAAQRIRINQLTGLDARSAGLSRQAVKTLVHILALPPRKALAWPIGPRFCISYVREASFTCCQTSRMALKEMLSSAMNDLLESLPTRSPSQDQSWALNQISLEQSEASLLQPPSIQEATLYPTTTRS